MKNRCLLMLFLPAYLTGCTVSSQSLGGGYELSTLQAFSWEPSIGTHTLYYRGANGARSRVWPNYVFDILVHDRTALFVAPSQNRYKLFGVTNGTPRLEVGTAILAFEAQRKGQDVSAFLQQHELCPSSLKRLTDGVELQYPQRQLNSSPLHLSLTWDELSTVMRRVQAQGRPQKDKSGMSYLQIDYSQNR
jgi:hypothetical protein